MGLEGGRLWRPVERVLSMRSPRQPTQTCRHTSRTHAANLSVWGPLFLPQACSVDGFEVPFGHSGNRLSVEVPQVGSLHAGRAEQQLVISF